MAAEAAGWLFLGLFRIIKEVYDEPAFQQVIAATHPTARRVLAERIRVMG